MKPWHTRQDSRSDFAATATGATRMDAPPSPGVVLARGISSVGAATFLLAFTEACLHLEQRPIPLRFAARYAAVNVIPSAVWKTVPVHYVAAAANLPPTRLVTAAADAIARHGEPNLASAPRRANRLVAIHTLRSVRSVVASYGLVWALWRWHETQQSVDEDSAKAPHPAGRVERVVRLAPAGSSLSVATAEKHGTHVVQIPWKDVRGNSIDWSTIGLGEAWRQDVAGGGGDANGSGSGVKVLELEIDSEHDDASAFMIAKRTASGSGSGVRTIALVDPAAAPAWRSRGSSADVYFFALSGIIRFLSDHSDDAELILTVSEDLNDDAAKRFERMLSFVQHAMVHRVGVRASLDLHHLAADEPEDDDEEYPVTQPVSKVAVFAPTAEAAVKRVNDILQSGTTSLNCILVVVDQSITTLPAPLPRCAGVLSVADLSDSVLQRIRVQLRAGSSPEAIQQSIFEDFGEQSALLHRVDAASDTTKYI